MAGALIDFSDRVAAAFDIIRPDNGELPAAVRIVLLRGESKNWWRTAHPVGGTRRRPGAEGVFSGASCGRHIIHFNKISEEIWLDGFREFSFDGRNILMLDGAHETAEKVIVAGRASIDFRMDPKNGNAFIYASSLGAKLPSLLYQNQIVKDFCS